MNLLEAITEAIFRQMEWESRELNIPPNLLRELIASKVVDGKKANWEEDCLAEAYMEYPWIPPYNNSESWERIELVVDRLGYAVYSELYNLAVMTIQPKVWPQDDNYPKIDPNISKRFASSTKKYSERVTETIERDIFIRGISSPIEQLFYFEWCLAETERTYASIHGYHLVPQFAFKKHDFEWSSEVLYKVDFAIQEVGIDYKLKDLKIAIECDGFVYHERDKSQFEYEKRRERYLQSLGWRLIRFAGTEINRDPRKCVLQVFDLLDKERVEHAEASYYKA